MSKPQSGLNVFKIAGRSISGCIPSLKTGDPRHIRQPFTSLLEERLALYLEYHPSVVMYHRGDVSDDFASSYGLVTPLGSPYRIHYLYDGKPHEYWPDFVGMLSDGNLLIAEAGREEDKRQPQALAKAQAARRLVEIQGGTYWIGTEHTLDVRRHQNLVFLHGRRRFFDSFAEITESLLHIWPWCSFRTVHEAMKTLGTHWPSPFIEACIWKMVGDAAAEGRLLVDLTEIVLDRSTPLALLEPSASPLFPTPLPHVLEFSADEQEPEDTDIGFIPGAPFDGMSLDDPKERATFLRNIHAVTAVMKGQSLRQSAREAGMDPMALSRLIRRTQEMGQIACVPRATYARNRGLRPEFQEMIRALYLHPKRPTIMDVYEDVRLQELADELSQKQGMMVSPPTYWQVWRYIDTIRSEPDVHQSRSGEQHALHEPQSPLSFVLSVPRPAHYCQVDEHTMDCLVVTTDGIEVTQRVHGAVMICVKTAAILGAVLALDTLKEEDYMRLLKQTLEPKERLVTLYDCHYPWPCSGKPDIIFHDRGKIFTSERATHVIVDRLGIITERAPSYCPSAKGTVESLFTWVTRKFTHRLPGTTKSTPHDRGTYDSDKEARKAGITFDILEQLFYQAIVDSYMQEWDELRGQTRLVLWNQSVETMGVNPWMGSPDDLKLLLMKAINRKNPTTGKYAIHPGKGLLFLGRRYVSPGLLNRLYGQEITIYYDRRDLSVIYLSLNGELVGEAYCTDLMGKRVSIWESQAKRASDLAQAQIAATIGKQARQRIQKTAASGKRVLAQESKRLAAQRQMDQQRSDIHPAQVAAMLQALEQYRTDAPPDALPSLTLPPATPNDQPNRGRILPIRKRGQDS